MKWFIQRKYFHVLSPCLYWLPQSWGGISSIINHFANRYLLICRNVHKFENADEVHYFIDTEKFLEHTWWHWQSVYTSCHYFMIFRARVPYSTFHLNTCGICFVAEAGKCFLLRVLSKHLIFACYLFSVAGAQLCCYSTNLARGYKRKKSHDYIPLDCLQSR